MSAHAPEAHSDNPRALLVSWLFPPHSSIGAKRAYRFARHLPTHGWNVTVLCGRAPPARFHDPTDWSVPDGVRVEHDYDAAWLTSLANHADARAERARAVRRDSVPPPTAPRAPSLLERLAGRRMDLAHDLLPTETIAVHLPHAIAAARRIAARDSAEVVWTTSYPYSAHLVGVSLRRTRGIPFVADLRDPWTLNFVHERKLPPARAAERALERLVFTHADRIVVTTEALADAYRVHYPSIAERFVTIRNGFDPVHLPPRDLPEDGPVRLVHFGHVYSERTLAPLLRSLARLLARNEVRRDVVIENLGRLSDEDRATARALGLDANVRARDPLPYAEGLAYLRRAHALLLPAWGTERGSLLLPGKLYDYLLAGAPVLAVGQNPELAAILARTCTGVLVAPDDEAALDRALARAIEGTLPFAPDHHAVAAFSAPFAAARLAQVFDEVRGSGRLQASGYSGQPGGGG